MNSVQRYISNNIRSKIWKPLPLSALQYSPPLRCLSATNTHPQHKKAEHNEPIRLTKLIASHGLNMQMSRKSAEMLIKSGQVTLAGEIIQDPSHKMSIKDAMNGVKVAGRLLRLPDYRKKVESPKNSEERQNDLRKQMKQNVHQQRRTRVWVAHKLSGELVAEFDPQGRPSLIERLERGGVGKLKKGKKGKGPQRIHLKPIGRLDMVTEGLILVTNDGRYKREMELPSNSLHRTYRVRVHGRVTPGKLRALRGGMEVNGIFYKGMKVNIETNKGNRAKGGNTNTWLRITCVEGKNRQIRKTLDHLGLQVTRLIRISYGDYDLNTIPLGMAIEVPLKQVEKQKRRGAIESLPRAKQFKKPPSERAEDKTKPIEWIRHQ